MDIKITIVGETEVGKTSLVQYFVNETPSLQNSTTPCASFLKKVAMVNDKVINFQMWDTAGQERFRSIAPMYYRGSDCVLLVYDVGQQASYEQLKEFWVKEVQSKCPYHVIFALVANKQDITDQKVTNQEGRAFAQANQLEFYETSGKSGAGVLQMFQELAQKVIDQKQDTQIAKEDTSKEVLVRTQVTQVKQKKDSCCM
ncbi:Rab1a [Hexamita inflata]|uniref:Rab1a n=1 Tax=Hexamita inflata TaxID=28002 RepID=A0AA86P748_9EUKA|nr:Rab1a [Hexamita inflata]